jgi:hypothetical protein
MKKLLLLPLLMLSMTCNDPAQSETNKEKQNHWVHYYKDARTDVCFAAYNLGAYDALLTQVPCSPEVEKLVEPWPKYYQ